MAGALVLCWITKDDPHWRPHAHHTILPLGVCVCVCIQDICLQFNTFPPDILTFCGNDKKTIMTLGQRLICTKITCLSDGYFFFPFFANTSNKILSGNRGNTNPVNTHQHQQQHPLKSYNHSRHTTCAWQTGHMSGHCVRF